MRPINSQKTEYLLWEIDFESYKLHSFLTSTQKIYYTDRDTTESVSQYNIETSSSHISVKAIMLDL